MLLNENDDDNNYDFGLQCNEKYKAFDLSNVKSINVKKLADEMLSYKNKKTSFTPTTYNINIDNNEFTFVNLINYGSSGYVSLYKTNKNECIAIKQGILRINQRLKYEGLLQDIKIISTLHTLSKCTSSYTNIIPVDTDDDNKILIMEYMSGTLNKLLLGINNNVTLKNLKSVFQIILKILKDIYCLYTQNLFYTDIKLANILFRCDQNDKIKILLGDLGSISNKINNDECIATFPSPKGFFTTNKGFIDDVDISDLIWIQQVNIIIIIKIFFNINFVYTPFTHTTKYNNLNELTDTMNLEITQLQDHLILQGHSQSLQYLKPLFTLMKENFTHYDLLNVNNYYSLITIIHSAYKDIPI